MPLRYARAAARSGPSVSWRLRCLTSNSVAWLTAREDYRPWDSRRVRSAGLHEGAAAAVPARERGDIRAHGVGVVLAAGEMEVGARHQAALVGGQRHPFREDVIGRRQPARAVRALAVGELDAVFAEQARALRDVGDDRLVRVDQVGVGRHAVAVSRTGAAVAPHAQEAEIAVHLPVLVVDARAQKLAGALFGAALTARVIG